MVFMQPMTENKKKTFIFTDVIGYAARNSKHITVLRMETIREYMYVWQH